MGRPGGGMGHPKIYEWSSLKIISIKMLAALHHPFIHYVTLDSLGDNFPNHATYVLNPEEKHENDEFIRMASIRLEVGD